jgi:hypothetical protein
MQHPPSSSAAPTPSEAGFRPAPTPAVAADTVPGDPYYYLFTLTYHIHNVFHNIIIASCTNLIILKIVSLLFYQVQIRGHTK